VVDPVIDPSYLDLTSWSRRAAFEHFRGFEQPFFGVCTRLDVAPLKAAAAATGIGSLALAYHFVALRLANLHGPFRYRLEDPGQRVRVHTVVHGSTTVLRADDSFGFAHLHHTVSWADFCAQAAPALRAAAQPQAPFDAEPAATDLVYFTTLPWVHFSSFEHAQRMGDKADSVPRIAFGRLLADGPQLWLPLAVHVHHALMDGLHAGRFVQDFEAAVADPAAMLG